MFLGNIPPSNAAFSKNKIQSVEELEARMMHLGSFQNICPEKHDKNNTLPQDAAAFKKLLSQMSDNEFTGNKRCDEYQQDFSRFPVHRTTHPMQQIIAPQNSIPSHSLENSESFPNIIGFDGHSQQYLQSANISTEAQMQDILRRPEAQAIIEGKY